MHACFHHKVSYRSVPVTLVSVQWFAQGRCSKADTFQHMYLNLDPLRHPAAPNVGFRFLSEIIILFVITYNKHFMHSTK